MDSFRDKHNIENQLDELKRNVDKSKEYLSALEMLMVDNNNARIKDGNLSKDFKELNTSIETVSRNIQALQNKMHT